MAEPRYETIRPRTKTLGRRVVHLASATSTMDEARRLALDGAESGTVVVADQQTQGRGRNDRAWHSPPGSLYATIILRDEVATPLLPLVSLGAGAATAHAIKKLIRADARLKWPNDVWIDEQKVAGVLLETRLSGARPEHVLIGIGVNGDVRPEQLPLEIRATATSLSIVAQRHVCLPALLKLILEDLDRMVRALSAADKDPLLEEIRALSVVLGQRVRVETASGPAEGIAEGLGPYGELLVQTPQGRRVVNVGDCQLLRRVA
jgi:BirA family biotin operon repressor/biotin-[acetyl-CoA-carboxylase] ligase